LSVQEPSHDLPLSTSVSPKLSLNEYDSHTLEIETLSGIDKYAALHLKSLQITTVQQMASANPCILFLHLPYALSQIIDWVDQALLITCLEPTLYNALRKYGVTSATGLIAFTNFSSYIDIDRDQLLAAKQILEENSQFVRLSNFSKTPQIWMMEMLAVQSSDSKDSKYINYSIIQRFNNYSPLVIPGSVIAIFGCFLILWMNLRAAAEQLTTLIVSAALAQTSTSHIGGLPSNVRSIIACFLASGILITLCVCLYSGFIAKKPSQRAADAVRTILSFSFGIVTGSLSGGT
jgi:hypothetical protein